MNILQFIKAGHYPFDGMCRPLVKTDCKWTATIVAIDGPGDYPIIGFGPNSTVAWTADGTPWAYGARDGRLLPPSSK